MNNISIFNNKITYLSEIRARVFLIYWVIIIILITAAFSLPLIKIPISVKSQGIIRPKNERTELKSYLTTVIDRINFKEGDTVKKGDVIAELHKENLTIKRVMNDFEISQRDQYINDLVKLTSNSAINDKLINGLESSVYKQQSSRFAFQLAELNTQLKKISKELYIDSMLFEEKVITPKEIFDKRIEHEKIIANIRTTKIQQLSIWQGELVRHQLERTQYRSANSQLNDDSTFYSIKTPITGVLQDFNKFYPGSLIQAGEVLAVISPEAELIAECYIKTSDIGLLKLDQKVLFQVDAFDYNYFGVLTGKILSINNDYTIVDNRPVFMVKCVLDSKQMHLKNGFTGTIKKGMTFQARFVIAERTLWQLLFDKIDDWVNPNK